MEKQLNAILKLSSQQKRALKEKWQTCVENIKNIIINRLQKEVKIKNVCIMQLVLNSQQNQLQPDQKKNYIEFTICRFGYRRMGTFGCSLLTQLLVNKAVQMHLIIKSKSIKNLKSILKNPMYLGVAYKQQDFFENQEQAIEKFTLSLFQTPEQVAAHEATPIYLYAMKEEDQNINGQEEEQSSEPKHSSFQTVKYIDIAKIQETYLQYKATTEQEDKEKTVILVLEQYIQKNDEKLICQPNMNQDILRLIEYIIPLENEKFRQEFFVQNYNQRNLFKRMLYDAQVNTISELKAKVKIAKHFQFSVFQLDMSEEQFNKVPHRLFQEIFDNIENRIMNIYSNTHRYIIAHRVSDKFVFTQYIANDGDIAQAITFIKKLDPNEMYDLIIVRCPSLPIERLCLRSLFYTNDSAIQTKLNNYENLVSLSLGKVCFSSYNNFERLRNLYIFKLNIQMNQINNLTNLQRLYIVQCQFTHPDNISMLKYLLQHNDLQYISVVRSQGVINDQDNLSIRNVRHFFNYDENVSIRCDIKMFFTGQLNSMYQIFLKLDFKKNYNQNQANLIPLKIQKYNFKIANQKIYPNIKLKFKYILMFMQTYINIWDWRFYFINRAIFYEYNSMYANNVKTQYQKLSYYKITYHLNKSLYQSKYQRKRYVTKELNIKNIQKFYKVSSDALEDPGNQLFKQVYDRYIAVGTNQYGSDSKYTALLVLNTILNNTSHQLSGIYGQLNRRTIQYICDFINQYVINSQDEINTKLKLSCTLPYNYTVINFSNNLTYSQFNKEDLALMFTNVEKRLQRIQANQKMFLIKKVNDDEINAIYEEGFDQSLIELKKRLGNDNLYDAIVVKSQPLCIENIRLRYLNAACEGIQRKRKNNNHLNNIYKFSIKYPHDLISLTLESVNLQNIRECINVENFDSVNNFYKFGMLSSWNKLKIFSSYKDYQKQGNDGQYIVNDLFTHNTMQYVSVSNSLHMLHTGTISEGLSELRFFYFYNSMRNIDVQLDITQCFPHHLKVARCAHRNRDTIVEQNFKFIGNLNDVQRLELQLITF